MGESYILIWWWCYIRGFRGGTCLCSSSCKTWSLCEILTWFVHGHSGPSLPTGRSCRLRGASFCGGGLIWAKNAAQLVWRGTVSPLRGSTSTPPLSRRNRGPHHITLRGASCWPGTALPITHYRKGKTPKHKRSTSTVVKDIILCKTRTEWN